MNLGEMNVRLRDDVVDGQVDECNDVPVLVPVGIEKLEKVEVWRRSVPISPRRPRPLQCLA